MQHHAYYIEDTPSRFEEYKASLKPFWACYYERFGVEESRELIALAGLKNFTEPIYFVGAMSITVEAQQALLKLLEEPQEGTTFIFLIPHGSLLPTVKSRMLEYGGEKRQPAADHLGSSQRDPHRAAAFLKASGKERGDLIATMLKDDEGVRERVLDFVNGIEALLAHDSKRHRAALEDLAMTRDYLHDRSPSIKMLLENLALCIPQS